MERSPTTSGVSLENEPLRQSSPWPPDDAPSRDAAAPSTGDAQESTAGQAATPHVPPPSWSHSGPSTPTAAPPPSPWPAPWESAPTEPLAPPTATDEAVRSRGRLVPLFLAALLGAVLGTGATLVAGDRLGGDTTVQGGGSNVRTPLVTNGGDRSSQLQGVAAVAEAVTPSIVRIKTTVSNGFFGQSQATGSGVIYRSDGYIITNHHVVEGASKVEVVLSSGDTLEGRVIGTAAPVDDIAVVKVDRTGLQAARLGSIANVRVGDLAIAIGSPFGLQGTVTAGIVSALHRNEDLGGVRITEAIQTDAPINPGNSGGALVNAKGELIGIPTAIVGGQGNVGIGFAIPIDIAKRDADEIIESGRARRPLLGVLPETVHGTSGAFVREVTPGTPAAASGLQSGDVIVKVGPHEIKTGEDLILAISQFRVGDRVTVTFVRGGKTQSVDVTLAARAQ